MPSQKPDISKNILQNVLQKHIHVTSLTDNIPTNIKVMTPGVVSKSSKLDKLDSDSSV